MRTRRLPRAESLEESRDRLAGSVAAWLEARREIKRQWDRHRAAFPGDDDPDMWRLMGRILGAERDR